MNEMENTQNYRSQIHRNLKLTHGKHVSITWTKRFVKKKLKQRNDIIANKYLDTNKI